MLSDPLLEKLRAGEIDVGILALPVDMDGLESATLYDEPFALAVPANHPLAERERVKIDDLRGETLLLLEDGHCLRDQALEVCSRVRVNETQDYRATSLETLRQMVAAGHGITLLPELAAETPVGTARGLRIKPFAKPAPGRTVGAVWRKSSTRGRAIEAITNAIRATIREEGRKWSQGRDAPCCWRVSHACQWLLHAPTGVRRGNRKFATPGHAQLAWVRCRGRVPDPPGRREGRPLDRRQHQPRLDGAGSCGHDRWPSHAHARDQRRGHPLGYDGDVCAAGNARHVAGARIAVDRRRAVQAVAAVRRVRNARCQCRRGAGDSDRSRAALTRKHGRTPGHAKVTDSGACLPVHRLQDEEIERLLASGERKAELTALFGEQAYRELSALARRAAAKRTRGGPHVYVLPGLMGSRIGSRGSAARRRAVGRHHRDRCGPPDATGAARRRETHRARRDPAECVETETVPADRGVRRAPACLRLAAQRRPAGR